MSLFTPLPASSARATYNEWAGAFNRTLRQAIAGRQPGAPKLDACARGLLTRAELAVNELAGDDFRLRRRNRKRAGWSAAVAAAAAAAPYLLTLSTTAVVALGAAAFVAAAAAVDRALASGAESEELGRIREQLPFAFNVAYSKSRVEPAALEAALLPLLDGASEAELAAEAGSHDGKM